MIALSTLARVAVLTIAAQYEDQGADPSKGIDLFPPDARFLSAYYDCGAEDVRRAIAELREGGRWVEAGEGVSLSFEEGRLRRVEVGEDATGADFDEIFAAAAFEGAATYERSEDGGQLAVLREE